MHVVVLRHGIAIDREDPACPVDPERFLTERGRRRTFRAAQGLDRLGVQPDVVWTSPWRRADETARICVEVLGVDPAAVSRRDDLLPGADPRAVIADLQRTDATCVLIVGHAPHLDRLLCTLLTGEDGTMSALKKSGAASIVLGGEWSGATLEWSLPPKVLRRLGRR